MKNDFLKISSKRILFSALMVSAMSAGFPSMVYAETGMEVVQKTSGQVLGTVLDSNGEPIIGASVLVKGTSNGTITDFDGKFVLENASGTLVISYIGYKTQEVVINNQKILRIVLKEDTEVLDEVVVVGYGTQKKATLTGAVSMIDADETIKGRATSNVAISLQGAIPGLTITRTTSRPTEDPSISLRGGISTNSNPPLILIDGSEAYSWELNTINPNDIENISVLKDASASIYGARAAGGVMLVTTKRGKAEKLKISYNGSLTLNYQGRDYPAATGSEWAQMMLNATHNDPNTSPWGILGFTEKEYERIVNNEAFDWVDPTSGYKYRIDPLNAYQPDYVYGTTLSHRHNFSLSGGNEKIKTNTSVGYSDDRSIIKVTYDGQRRYNFRNNMDFQFNKYLKLSTNIAYDYREKDTPSYGIGYGLQDFYVFPLYTQDGTKYYDNFGGNNVLAHLTEGGRSQNQFSAFRLTAKADLDLSFIHKSLEGLSFSVKANIRQDNTNRKDVEKTIQMYDYYTGEVTNNAQAGSRCKTPTLYESNSRNKYQDYEFFLNYDRMFDKHHITAMIGNTNELRENHSLTVRGTAKTNQELEEMSVYDPSSIQLYNNSNHGTSEAYKWAFVSFLGRVNYDYAGKYMIEGTWRRDGSSKLVKEQRWDNFFGVSGGWRISEENFVKDNIDWLSNLKLRASWGEAGNLGNIGNYESYATIDFGTTVLGTTPSLVNTAWISGLVDNTRTWERVETTNIGLDLGLFNNRLSGTFDYYWRKNKGMLMGITYPQILGVGAPSTNSGTYKAHGWELSLNWQDQINKDWGYNVGFTLADAKTEIESYAGAIAKNPGLNKIVEGYPLNSLWVYKSDGLFQNQAEVDEYYAQMNGHASGSLLGNVAQGTDNALTPGSVRRVDLNGDNDITPDDLYYYGDTAPHYTFGINLGLHWKSLDFSAFFQGVGQQYSVRTGPMGCGFSSGWTNTNAYYLDHTWTDDSAPYYAGNQGDDVFPILSRNGKRNDWNYKHYNDINVINSWYVRCKSIQLGYTLPKNLIAKVGLQNLRVWVSGDNLFDLSNVKDGMDPEVNYSSGTYSGLEVFSSSVSFGLDVTF